MKFYKTVAISDLHIGKSNSPKLVDDVISHFNINVEEFSTATYLVIGGDFFDKLLNMASTMLREAIRLFRFLEEYSCKWNITILWVEGTQSHDYGQVGTLLDIIPKNGSIRYYDTIDIFIDEKRGISTLFIPDNMGTADSIWDMTISCLNRYGLKKVDQAVMHGVFDFQLPEAHDEYNVRLDSSKFLDIVEDYIYIGHHHTRNVKGRIIPTGSFGRYKFGEEEPKGSTITIVNGSTKVIVFIENINADIFMDVKSSLSNEEITEKISKYPDNSSFRFFYNNEDDKYRISTLFDTLPFNVKLVQNDNKVNNIKDDGLYKLKKIDLSDFTPQRFPYYIVDKLKYKLTEDELLFVNSLINEEISSDRLT